ncbi:MAG: carbohydrate ABC transporter substrate-binding protein [Nocardioides sp.]|nr:carbohydrate ABC transporter substrate-binding protein [Nocardioides sp.]
MKYTRSTAAAALAAISALALSACAGGTPASSGVDAEGEIAGEIGIAWWGGDSRHQKTNAVIDMFEEEYPDVTTDRQGADWSAYWDKLNVQASSKSLPCVVQLQGRQVNDYTKYDLLLPLDPMIESGSIDVTNIPESVLAAGRGTDGNLYFLPYGAAYDAVGINETLAAEAGVSVPEEGYTWDDYFAMVRSAGDGMPDGTTAIGLSGGIPNYFIGWMLSNGNDLFAEDGKLGFSQDQLIDYWSMWEELRAEGLTETADRMAEQPTAPDQSYFANGQTLTDTLPGNALTPASTTLAGRGDATITTVPYPSGNAGSGNALYPSGFAIPGSCDNVSTAAAFIDFFTNDLDAGLVFAGDNGAPTNSQVLSALLEDPELSETKQHELALFEQIVQNDPPSIVFPPGYQATFEASFKRAYEDVVFERRSIEEAVQTFFDEANATLGS